MTDINSWADLHNMRNALGDDYTLQVDLDSSSPGYSTYAGPTANGGLGWEPVGDDPAVDRFNGKFDGNGHTISDLVINRGTELNVGLFGYTTAAAEIDNAKLLNANITGDDYTGGVVGRNLGTINDSYTTGSITGNGGRGGGLVGMNEGTITECYSTASVNCFTRTGGLVGHNFGGTIIDCYAQGAVSGNNRIGGLVGQNSAQISRSYSTGAVSGSISPPTPTLIGGLVGENLGVVFNSFWDTQTSGQGSSAGGSPKTTAEMKTLSTFAGPGWDIVLFADYADETWYIDENNDYPRLGWQYPDLPPGTIKSRDAVYILIQLMKTSPYSEEKGGNIIIRSGWDVDEDIPSPSIIVTSSNQVTEVIANDGAEDQITETLQLDCFARSEAEVQQLKYEVERIIIENRRYPGSVLPDGSIFNLLLPGQWINNDALNQAEGLYRRTTNIQLIRYRGA